MKVGEDSILLPDYERITQRLVDLELSPDTRNRVEKRRKELMSRLKTGEVIYGVNTGFGRLKDTRIPSDKLRELQVNLIRSHAVGTGAPLPQEIIRGVLALRSHALAFGYSGVRAEVIDQLLAFIKADIIPFVPEQGSVGASGDLAPLAHIALCLMGEGECLDGAVRVKTTEVMARHHLSPLQLEAREGLALINGTQASTAVLADAVLKASWILSLSCASLALSLDVLQASIHPTDPEINDLRPHPGQRWVSQRVRTLLEGSEILPSHATCGRIQDAYSLRCAPQVHGAAYEALTFARNIVEIEMNSVTDNPIILEGGKVLHNGNFHGAPIALAADMLATALTSLSAISERRLFRLTSPELSGLPPFLAQDPGLNSGYMILHVLAASLVNENKTLSHPASVDTIPTSDNQEDHVSMSMWAARKARTVADNTLKVIACEILAAAQGLEFHRPKRSGSRIESLISEIRKILPFRERDCVLAVDLENLLEWLKSPTTRKWFDEFIVDPNTPSTR